MSQLTLTNTLLFRLENNNKKIRLILTEGDIELACRKETLSNLRSFIRSDQESLFKGRLQLHRQDNAITITLKGQPAGVVTIAAFNKALNTLA
jgi:hypothetical protein